MLMTQLLHHHHPLLKNNLFICFLQEEIHIKNGAMTLVQKGAACHLETLELAHY